MTGKMVEVLYQIILVLCQDSSQDASMWFDWFQGFQAIVTAMQVEENAPAASGQLPSQDKVVQYAMALY